MNIRPLTIPVIALALTTTALAGCGSDEAASTGTVAAAQPAGDAAGMVMNDSDVEFSQGMIAHHQQAIEMAEIALDPNIGASPAVVDLATRIKGAQDPEVELLTGWLTDAGHPVAMSETDGHDMSSMDGMMTADQMDAMSAMTGVEFDQMWLALMIEHHQGAIAQSQTVKTDGSNPEALALADQIISAQQAEIDEMQTLLQG